MASILWVQAQLNHRVGIRIGKQSKEKLRFFSIWTTISWVEALVLSKTEYQVWASEARKRLMATLAEWMDKDSTQWTDLALIRKTILDLKEICTPFKFKVQTQSYLQTREFTAPTEPSLSTPRVLKWTLRFRCSSAVASRQPTCSSSWKRDRPTLSPWVIWKTDRRAQLTWTAVATWRELALWKTRTRRGDQEDQTTLASTSKMKATCEGPESLRRYRSIIIQIQTWGFRPLIRRATLWTRATGLCILTEQSPIRNSQLQLMVSRLSSNSFSTRAPALTKNRVTGNSKTPKMASSRARTDRPTPATVLEIWEEITLNKLNNWTNIKTFMNRPARVKKAGLPVHMEVFSQELRMLSSLKGKMEIPKIRPICSINQALVRNQE